MNPLDWKRFVMRSWIFAFSAGETASEFNASSENSRWRVSDTFSPASTIPCQKHKQGQMIKNKVEWNKAPDQTGGCEKMWL